MSRELLKPIFEADSIRFVHFFNGRLLSGEDLSQEQTANRQARWLLGRALGVGVVYGLEVRETQGVSTKQAPVVTVAAGLAVNRLGHPLQLTAPVDVSLVRPGQTGSAPITALFVDCDPLKTGPYVVGEGIYLLTIQPASGPDGKAPVSGLGNLDAACNARYHVDGVQFRLVQLPVAMEDLSDAARLRNRLAYRCFGASDPDFVNFFANPFGPTVSRYGLLDDLPADCLKDAEVPLALIYWTVADGVKFVDRWSVRRRVTHPSGDMKWSLLTSDRRMAEAEARFLQFEDQIEDIRADPNETPGTVHASDRFKYLPPAGLLPIIGENSPGGFSQTAFFGDLAPAHLDVMDAARLQYLVCESFQHEALPVDDKSYGKLALYLIRENLDAVASGAAAQLVAVFARPELVYSGMPRFDYSAWDVGRFK